MFSIITMALSTSIPTARISAKRITMLIVSPSRAMIRKVSNIDIGMAIPTRKAFLTPITRKSTATTSTSPLIMLFSRLLVVSRT